MKTVIEQIQDEDPSYDPLTIALRAAGTTKSLWNAATDRIYHDGYYGPINPQEWKEQDGRKPYYIDSAIKVVARVLDKVEDVWQYTYCDEIRLLAEEDEEYDDYDFCEEGKCKGHRTDLMAPADEIKAALVHPWYKEIYGQRYPQL